MNQRLLPARRLAFAAMALIALPVLALKAVEKAAITQAFDRTAYDPGSPAKLATQIEIEAGWHVNSHTPTFDYLIPTSVEVTLPAGWEPARMTYPPGSMQTFAFADQPLSVYAGKVVVMASFTVPKSTPPGRVSLRVKTVYQACNHDSCLPPVTQTGDFALVVGPGGEPNHLDVFTGAAPAGTTGSGSRSLGAILLFALLGGLILNAMPCVLPVLSLKVFGLVRSAGEGRQAITTGALATAAGILLSFWALALAAIGAKAAGSAVGWGIQFQNPAFVTFLAVVILLFCLNLWGLFEITLPASLARVGNASAREGVAGHFASGLFATLMATPCSAPFLGTALGFALGQKAGVILAVFTAVGIGMSLPYLALAVAPGVAKLLPRPGAWMDTVKGAMGFLLAGGLVWLLFVLTGQISAVRLAMVEVGLLVLALFLWWRGRSTGLGRRLAFAGALAVMIGTVVLAAYSPTLAAQGGTTTAAKPEAGGSLIAWSPFDEAQAQALVAEGRPVFVDVTADWCFTCKFNEARVLNTQEVAAAFERHGVLAMKADWTNRNDAIGDYLARFGRYGIPFYVLYQPAGEPHVFSELLSQEALLQAVAASGAAKLAEKSPS